MRSKFAMDSDKAIVSSSNNNNHGLTLLAGSYDTIVTEKLGVSALVAHALYSEKATAKSNSIGTEINAQIDYKLEDNLTIRLQGAYVFLGDAINTVNGKTADNPYLTALVLNLVF